ncbi:MAG: hypothetical protein RL226_284 [Bacteroidota bacterium]
MKWLPLVIVLSGCGIAFETLTLDTGSSPKVGDGFQYFTAQEVFKDADKDVWGMEQVTCKDASVKDVGGTHKRVIHLNWNKSSCDWVGFGIGWQGWLPKDLSGVMETGDLVFDLRAATGQSGIPTFIFILEDYAGAMSAGVAGSGCLERYPVDTVWQECRLPLSAFDYKRAGIDLTNVKQLVVELQGAGDVYLDNIRITPHEKRVIPGKKVFPSSTVVINETTPILGAAGERMWGLGDYDRRVVDYVDGMIQMSWTTCDDCFTHKWGVTWNNWKAMDLSGLPEEAGIRMQLQSDMGEPQLMFTLTSYDGSHGDKVIDLPANDQWQSVFIPLRDLKGVNLKRVKDLTISLKGHGSVTMKDLMVVVDEK